MKIYIGSDHAGFRLKERLKRMLTKEGYDITDKGNLKFDPHDDYPDYAFKVAKAVAKDSAFGILICGSSQGVAIASNKIRGIRAVSVDTIKDAVKTREHNDANILCLSGWKLDPKRAFNIAKRWLDTPFSDEPRHKRRVDKITRFENERI